MSSPEQIWINLTKREDKVSSKEVAAAFSALKPVKPDFLTRGNGEWDGGSIKTGHPADAKLMEMNWAGKTFRSTEDVDPIMVFTQDGGRKPNADWGRARVREVKRQDTVTAAMIYDSFPIIDYFRYVSEDMVAGIMDTRNDDKDGNYYFYLTRRS